MNLLERKVLKLNKKWQAADTTTVQVALENMCRGAEMALDTSTMQAVGWTDWIKLPIRDEDLAIRTVHGPVRIPTVVVTTRYGGYKTKRPKLGNDAIRKRDGCVCQVTGEFAPDGNVDHGIPRSRGGKDTWENLRWMRSDLNSLKADRTLEEMGWKPIRPARAPKELKPHEFITPEHPDWVQWLKKSAA